MSGQLGHDIRAGVLIRQMPCASALDLVLILFVFRGTIHAFMSYRIVSYEGSTHKSNTLCGTEISVVTQAVLISAFRTLKARVF